MKRDALREARALLASLPLFAQGLAGHAGVSVVFSKQATTAKTDGKEITLPPLPLPMHERDADQANRLFTFARGFVAHEVGHVRFTDFRYLNAQADLRDDSLLKSIWNAIEDPLQEREFIKVFRGAGKQLDDMTEALIGHPNFYQPLTAQDTPKWLVAAYLLYALRAELRDQAAFRELAEQSRPALVEVFGEGFVTRLDVLVDVHGPKLGSTQDALDLARRVKQAMEEEQKKQQDAADKDTDDSNDGATDDGGGDAGDEGEDGDQDAADSGGSQGTTPDADGDGDGDGDADADAGDTSVDGDQGGQGPADPSAAADALRDALDGNGRDLQDLGEALAQELKDTSEDIKRSGSDGEIADHDSAPVVAPGAPARSALTRGHFDPMEALGQSGRLRALLSNELQSLQLLREEEAARGSVLNQRTVHRTSTGDRRLFLRMDERRRLNTAVFLLADVSGSMLTAQNGAIPIDLTSKALFATATALNGLSGVTTAVGTFPHFGMALNFGESAARNASNFALGTTGCTPMAEGVLWASRMLAMRQEERKLLIVLTDGQPDNPGTTKAQIAAAERMGIECMGLGICLPMISTLFAQHAVIQKIEEIAPAMLSMVRGALRSQLQAA